MVWWIFARGGTVIYLSQTDRQLAIGMKELGRALRDSGLPYERFHRVLRVGGEDRLIAMTSNSADSLRGFHDPDGLLVVIDEGQGASVEATAYDAAFSCATAEGDRIVVLGNPAHPGGRFHAIARKGSWRSLRIPAFEHPNIREGRVVIPGGPAPDWPETIEEEYGTDSPFYTAFVEAEFPESGIDSLVEAAWCRRAMELPAPKELHDAAIGAPILLVLDVARYGGDECVLGHMQGPILSHFETWRGKSLVESAKILRKRLRELGQIRHEQLRVVVDDAGVGGGVTDTLAEWGVRNVSPFNAANKPRGPNADRFANARAQSYWTVRERLRTGQLCIPADELLLEELLATEYGLNGQGRIQIAAKDDIKAHIGRSPDRADVLSMGVWEGTTRGRAEMFDFRLF